MRWHYKVTPMATPWYWGYKGERYAEKMQEALNNGDNDGWEFVDAVSAGQLCFLVFRKPRANAADDHSTAIKEL